MFHKQLKSAMASKGLTGKELAARVGLPASSISHYVNGKFVPSRAKQEVIAAALGVDVDFLNADAETPDTVYGEDKITVKQVAAAMKKGEQFVRCAIERGKLPFAFALKIGPNSHNNYFINPRGFREYLGVGA